MGSQHHDACATFEAHLLHDRLVAARADHRAELLHFFCYICRDASGPCGALYHQITKPQPDTRSCPELELRPDEPRLDWGRRIALWCEKRLVEYAPHAGALLNPQERHEMECALGKHELAPMPEGCPPPLLTR